MASIYVNCNVFDVQYSHILSSLFLTHHGFFAYINRLRFVEGRCLLDEYFADRDIRNVGIYGQSEISDFLCEAVIHTFIHHTIMHRHAFPTSWYESIWIGEGPLALKRCSVCF